MKMNRYVEAEPLYLELLKLDARNMDALNNLVVINGQKQAVPRAKMYLDRALTVDPDSIKAKINMGNYYVLMNQPQAAQAWFAKAVAAEPHNCLAHIGLGTRYLRTHRLQEALIHIQEAVTLRPDYVRGYDLLIEIYQQLGQEEQVRACEELRRLFRQ
jgi:Tfp pilus assembly protein PilF